MVDSDEGENEIAPFKIVLDHIDVYEAEGKGKNKTQRVVIHYNFVGYLEIPESDTPCFTVDTRQGVAIGYIEKPTEKSA